MATVTLGNLQTNLPTVMNLNSADIPTASITRASNWVKRNLQQKIDLYWTEKTTTIKTTAGNRTLGSLPADYHRAYELWIIDDTERVQLEFIDRHTETFSYPPVSNETQARPRAWYRRAKNLIVAPTPDAVYTVNVDYWAFLADLVNSGDNDDITNNHDELLLNGIAEIISRELGLHQEAERWQKYRVERERDLWFDQLEEEQGNAVIRSHGQGYLTL